MATPSPPMQISPGTPIGQRLQLLVEHPDRGVGDRPADGDAAPRGCATGHPPAASTRRWSRSGRTCSRARARAAEQSLRQVRRQALAADQRLEARAALPAGVEQQPPGAGRGLHHRGTRSRPAGGPGVPPSIAVSRGREHDRGADRQRQQQLQHRDVEGQRGDGHQPVVGAEARARAACCAGS